MKNKDFYELQSGKLVHQILEGVTFTYDLCFDQQRDHWKGINKEYNSKNGLYHCSRYDVPKT